MLRIQNLNKTKVTNILLKNISIKNTALNDKIFATISLKNNFLSKRNFHTEVSNQNSLATQLNVNTNFSSKDSPILNDISSGKAQTQSNSQKEVNNEINNEINSEVKHENNIKNKIEIESSKQTLKNNSASQFYDNSIPPPYVPYKYSRIQQISEEVCRVNPELNALHARLKLPQEFQYRLLSTALNCESAVNNLPKNSTLCTLGRSLINTLVTETLITKYPRIPRQVLDSAKNSYFGPDTMVDIGRIWGIEHERQGLPLNKVGINTPSIELLGRLRFNPRKTQFSKKVVKFSEKQFLMDNYKDSMSSAINSIIGAYYLSCGKAKTLKFIDAHILSRKVDISSLFFFDKPTVELSYLCARECFVAPITRLIAETGRLTSTPVFLVGVYSGYEKLGEGYGKSLREAKSRAAVDALKSWYLYSPSGHSRPSDVLLKPNSKYVPMHIDKGQVVV